MFENLPGFREYYPDRCALRNYIFEVWRNAATCFGFEEYDAPILEPLELFKEKSGEEIVGQLFSFLDRGGREVALRPEMTPSLGRLVGARQQSLKKPVKWFNIGEHFRYEKPQKGRTRAFFQFNADILGEEGVAADAELIALGIESLIGFGLRETDFVIRLSDRELWMDFLSAFDLEGDQASGVLSLIDKIERQDRATLVKQLDPYLGSRKQAFLTQGEELINCDTVVKIREFFHKQVSSSGALIRIESRLAEWEELLELLRAMGLIAFLKLDLGIVRGLAYYTGFVYEAFEKQGESRSLFAGGRYDGLLAKLGYADMPASGFAMGDVVLANLLEERELGVDNKNAPEIFMVFGGENERKVVLADAAKLRRLNFRVEYTFRKQGFGKQFGLAVEKRAKIALIYGSEELQGGTIKLRNMKTREETMVLRDALVDELKRIL